MSFKACRRTLNILLVCFGLLSFGGSIAAVGGGGVLNDLDAALIEIKDLEKRGLLNNPPETTSDIARREIKFLGSSQAVEAYIKEIEASHEWTTVLVLFFFFFFFLLAILRMFSTLPVTFYFS